MRIYLPTTAHLGNIDAFLKSIETSDLSELKIAFHPKWVSVHPIVLALVASLGESLKQRGVKILCEQMVAPSKNYFIRMGLFDYLGIVPPAVVEAHESAGRFIPLKRITGDVELKQFLDDLVPLLHLADHPEQAEAIKYTVSELVRNVLEHAESSQGAVVCAQYFKTSNKVAIGIADTGVGILKTMGAVHSVSTDQDAMRLALMPGVTGTTTQAGGTEANAGAGLFIVKSIAQVNRNYFLLYSGNAAYKLKRVPELGKVTLHADPLEDRHSFLTNLPYWQGTVVGIDISLNQTQSFASLLAKVREFYSLEKSRTKLRERMKRPKFI